MAEINNNIPKFSKNIEKVDVKKGKDIQIEPAVIEDKAETTYVADTGVLGRSQVRNAKGADISRSVDEAVMIATKNPALLTGSETIFDTIYNDLIESGMNESDAYMKALMAEEEFLALGTAYNK